MHRWCLALVAVLAACERDPIEQLDRPAAPSASRARAPAPPPAPPPPPPPAAPSPVPPPVEIASFLTEATHAAGPWHVTINDLAADDRAGRAPSRRFFGYRVTHVRGLDQARADDLVARLGLATSYNDGDVGCTGDPVGIAVTRGSASLDFVEDCSHVFLTEQGHAGRWALFSPEMATFVRGLRR